MFPDPRRTSDVVLGEIETGGNHARAEYVQEAHAAPFELGFERIEGEWKLDLGLFFAGLDGRLVGIAQQSGQAPDELVDDLLVMRLGASRAAEAGRPLVDYKLSPRSGARKHH